MDHLGIQEVKCQVFLCVCSVGALRDHPGRVENWNALTVANKGISLEHLGQGRLDCG